MIKDMIISPPFGNFINHKKCTQVMGTYTLNRRGSWLTKIYRGILTIRPTEGGWVNKIGLQNPGIKSVKSFNINKIYSISAINQNDWDEILEHIPKETTVEINLSCPNLDHEININENQVKKYLEKFPIVIFKLSPTNSIHSQVDKLVNLGVKYLHIANTIPTEKGGECGTRLKTFSLDAIKIIKSKHPNLKIIGGGGIYSKEDLDEYKQAGADFFSIASIWFNPLKAFKFLKSI